MRKAKIVATFGPAIDEYDMTVKAIKAGIDVARLNMSHGDYDEHENRYDNVRKASKELGKTVAIMADLQGPKIRLGNFENGPYNLAVGDEFTITTKDIMGNKDICGTTFKDLPGDVSEGDEILIDDGKIKLKAKKVTDTDVVTEVVIPGAVSNHKGINLPGVAVSVPAMSEKDERDLRWALKKGVDMVALSFVRHGDDVQRAHEIMEEEGIKVPIMAKVEKPQAIENLDSIIDAFDSIMVARGDLGVEVPFEQVPIMQKVAIEKARRWAKPVVVATQVLDSMIDNPRPTRAEASDCANAVLDGADAVMMSGETSVGKYPIETIEAMSRIIEATEDHGMTRIPDLGTLPKTYAGAITKSACDISKLLDVNAIVTFSTSGDSIRRMSRLRPNKALIGITLDQKTANQLALCWGVDSKVATRKVKNSDQVLDVVDEVMMEDFGAKKGDLVIVVSGSPVGKVGSTNCVRVHEIDNEGAAAKGQAANIGYWAAPEDEELKLQSVTAEAATLSTEANTEN
ncbi:MAG: pyruvate kinase [Micrococcaceae bacterium]